MSQTLVLNYIEAAIQATSGNPPCRQGIPNEGIPADIGQFPLMVLSVVEQEPVRMAFGTAGTVLERYAVIITNYLGPKNMAHDVAMSRAKVFPSRIRAAFMGDWKLGGNCWDSDLRGPASNLKIDVGTGQPMYTVQNNYPIQQWALEVKEETAANGAAL